MENINMKSTQLVADSYKSYHHSVYLYIYYKIGKDEEAKDLAQDVFLRLMDYKQMLRPETVKHFIFAICRNLVTDYLRRFYKAQEVTSYLFDRIPTCTNEVESQIIANNLLTCEWERANQLPEQRRKIYIMSRFEKINPRLILPPNWEFLPVRWKTTCLSVGKKSVNISNSVSNIRINSINVSFKFYVYEKKSLQIFIEKISILYGDGLCPCNRCSQAVFAYVGEKYRLFRRLGQSKVKSWIPMENLLLVPMSK